jgi:LPXTG-site transpeptidase (sortase) family protein
MPVLKPKFKPKKYLKDESFDPFYKTVNWSFYARMRLYPAVLLTLGVFVLITQVVLPLIVFTTRDETPPSMSSTVLGAVSGFGEFEFRELAPANENLPIDGEVEGRRSNVPEFFYITIPKLGIENALVETNPADLNPDHALGRYIGTSLPGEPGNIFIYGHSVLSVFYNPKNYKTIFSTLGDLETGDEFTIKYNNQTFLYKVESKAVLSPEQVNPLAEFKPSYLNESTVVLMTCWPPGTISKRLVVNAVMVR